MWPRSIRPQTLSQCNRTLTTTIRPSATSEERTVQRPREPLLQEPSILTTCSQTIWKLISTSESPAWHSRYSSLKEQLQRLLQSNGQWVTVTILLLILHCLPQDYRHWLVTRLVPAQLRHLFPDTSDLLRPRSALEQNGVTPQSSETSMLVHQSPSIMGSSGSTPEHPPTSRYTDRQLLQAPRIRSDESR